MHCQDCPRYDDTTSACRDGKLNPLRWELAVDVANVYGLRSICVFNDHRERLVKCRAVSNVARSVPKPLEAGLADVSQDGLD